MGKRSSCYQTIRDYDMNMSYDIRLSHKGWICPCFIVLFHQPDGRWDLMSSYLWVCVGLNSVVYDHTFVPSIRIPCQCPQRRFTPSAFILSHHLTWYEKFLKALKGEIGRSWNIESKYSLITDLHIHEGVVAALRASRPFNSIRLRLHSRKAEYIYIYISYSK